MKTFFNSSFTPRRGATRRGGFTLVEILVAVAIMSLLLAIIFVPLRLGFETYHIGTARTGLQQEGRLVMQQIGRDLQRATFVFPNTRVRGVSDSTNSSSSCSLRPYRANPPSGTRFDDWKYLPYFRPSVPPTTANSDPADPASGIGVTNVNTENATTLEAVPNLGRIDMLLARRNNTPGVSAQTGDDYVVTYYFRRLNIKAAFDAIDNPMVLFRAQYPYRYYTGSSFNSFLAQPTANWTVGTPNAQTEWTNYPTLGVATPGERNASRDRSYLWITHNYFGEANLEPLCVDADDSNANGIAAGADVIASHTLVTPRGMQLLAPAAGSDGEESLVPELSFVASTSNGNRIDRVAVNMTLAQYDQAGAAAVNGQGKAQRVALSQSFDLPNAECRN